MRIFTRHGPALLGNDKVRLSFAHYLVYESNRRYFDEVIRDYERLHPNVRIEQLDVPPPVWPTWRQTRFTGRTAPDIMQVGRAMRDDQFALYMRPLTEAVHEPNPYNRGTDLEGVPWKDTFLDALTTVGPDSESFRDQLMEFYGVPTYINIVRVFYNRDLHEQVMGHDRPPRTLADFLALCAKTRAYGAQRSVDLSPIAGSIEYSRNLFDRVMGQQTQRLSERIDAQRDGIIRSLHREHGLAWLRGEWRLDQPPVLTAFELMRELAQHYQPGFLNATRDEAGFLFKQSRALMIVSGSWDANYLMVDTKFRVGAFDIPLPGPEDGRFGEAPRGRLTELSQEMGGGFGVTRALKHPKIAIDFLRFLTSRKMNQKFANDCLRVPVVVGPQTPEEIAAFELHTQGYSSGFNLIYFTWASRAMERLHQAMLTRLVSPSGSVESYVAALQQGYAQPLRHDLEFEARERARAVMRSDALVLSLTQKHARAPATALEEQRLRRLAEFQTQQEADFYQTRLVLGETSRRLDSSAAVR